MSPTSYLAAPPRGSGRAVCTMAMWGQAFARDDGAASRKRNVALVADEIGDGIEQVLSFGLWPGVALHAR